MGAKSHDTYERIKQWTKEHKKLVLNLLHINTYTDFKKYILNIIIHKWHKHWQQLNTKLKKKSPNLEKLRINQEGRNYNN